MAFSSSPEQLQRSWDAAHMRVLQGDDDVFGRLSAPVKRQALARSPPEKRFPTVINLHVVALSTSSTTCVPWAT